MLIAVACSDRYDREAVCEYLTGIGHEVVELNAFRLKYVRALDPVPDLLVSVNRFKRAPPWVREDWAGKFIGLRFTEEDYLRGIRALNFSSIHDEWQYRMERLDDPDYDDEDY